MAQGELRYVLYIAAEPERVWAALTNPEETAQWWAHRNVSGWHPGDSWEHQPLDGGAPDLVGRIEEIDPPHRLVQSWAFPNDRARTSRLTIELEAEKGTTRLALTHVDLPEDQVDPTNRGWTIVLSSLKSYLETGRPLTSLLTPE